jgi:hypothetical protein
MPMTKNVDNNCYPGLLTIYNPVDPWIQIKQQVGEFWVCVIFFACVCMGASDSTIASGQFLLFLAVL